MIPVDVESVIIGKEPTQPTRSPIRRTVSSALSPLVKHASVDGDHGATAAPPISPSDRPLDGVAIPVLPTTRGSDQLPLGELRLQRLRLSLASGDPHERVVGEEELALALVLDDVTRQVIIEVTIELVPFGQVDELGPIIAKVGAQLLQRRPWGRGASTGAG
jgi:hypothetical protein